MRVLHIGKFYPPYAGGIENFLGDLLPALGAEGVDVAALVHREQFARASPEQVNARVKGDAPRVYRVPSYGRLLYAPISPQFPLWLRRVVREYRPQLLHLHLPNTSAFWALALREARRLPWVVHWHADVVASELQRSLALAYRLYRPLEQRLLACSRAIVVTSPPYLASSSALAPWRDKCRVVPLGLQPERLPEPVPELRAWAERQWCGSGMRVLAVGRLTYYKGHEVLIRAAAEAGPVQVLIVGRGEKHGEVEALVERLALQERVRLFGFCPDSRLHALMATCDCLVLPSVERTEAFGVVLLEAMRYGRSVVATAIPGSGPGWVVRHEETGLVVPPGDIEGLAAALRRLAQDEGLRARFGEAGQQRFRERFHIERVARQVKELYQTLVAEPAQRAAR